MPLLLSVLAFISLLTCGALFGLFCAGLSPIMQGLNRADPEISIGAMQSIVSIFPISAPFMLMVVAPVCLAVTSAYVVAIGRRRAAVYFASAAGLCAVGAFLLTVQVLWPLNRELAGVEIPQDTAMAGRIWAQYAGTWHIWTLIRASLTGGALVMAGAWFLYLPRPATL